MGQGMNGKIKEALAGKAGALGAPGPSDNRIWQDELAHKMIRAALDLDEASWSRALDLGCDPFRPISRQTLEIDGEGRVGDWDEDELNPIGALLISAPPEFFAKALDICAAKLGEAFSNVLDCDFAAGPWHAAVRDSVCWHLGGQGRGDLVGILADWNFFDGAAAQKIYKRALQARQYDFLELLESIEPLRKAHASGRSPLFDIIGNLISRNGTYFWSSEKEKLEQIGKRFPDWIGRAGEQELCSFIQGEIGRSYPNAGRKMELAVLFWELLGLSPDTPIEKAGIALREAFGLQPSEWAQVEEKILEKSSLSGLGRAGAMKL